MSVTRTIPLPIHAGIEAFAAPAIMAAPFALGLSAIATGVAVVVGAVLLGSALALMGSERAVSVTAHAGSDYALAYVAIAGAIVAGLAGDATGMVFLAGVGTAQLLLTATTRFSIARGA
jgi:hypothetical protein